MEFAKISIVYILFFFLIQPAELQSQSLDELYYLSKEARNEGNFDEAESYLYKMLLLKDSLTERHKIAIYNRIGLLNKDLGKFKKALRYFRKAEYACKHILPKDYSWLPLIYNNMAIIYRAEGDYEKALEYYYEAINSLNGSDLSHEKRMMELSKIHQNMGVVYRYLGDYVNAVSHFSESIRIKRRYGLAGLEKVFVNFARLYEQEGNLSLSEKYYLKSIQEWNNKKSVKSLYLSASVYNDYSSLLIKLGRKEEAIKYFKISHQIYLENYGERHPLTANSYLTIGDFYLQTGQIREALDNYQKSIISNTKTFNNSDIYSLPLLDDVIADMQLLKSLSKKSEALYKLSLQTFDNEDKTRVLAACISTAKLSLKHLSNIRRGYMSQSSKLNITEDEKKCFFQAIEASLKLFEITKNEKYEKQAYTFAQKSKASLLREEILQNKAFAAILPDSIRQNKQDIESNIYSYKKLIFDENQKKNPNKKKINNWSHSLFKLNNQFEEIVTKIKKDYAGYEKLTSKTEVISLKKLQERLKNGETLVEYSLSPANKGNSRRLFIFVVTKNQLNYFTKQLDSSFISHINYVRSQMNKHDGSISDIQEYNQLNQCLNQLYLQLIKPVEQYFSGSIIYIVPDEEIAYLSFDALPKHFIDQESINYASIPYLIYDYCFSYAYSSSLLFQDVPKKYQNEYVYAFAPYYSGGKISKSRFQFGKLENTEKEINSILTWFNGRALVGREANEEFFKTISDQSGIFHFAMHASAEIQNPDFSFLAITQEADNEEDGVFYNYEIAMMNMKASMVVLSGCNTGDGVISSGEGVMSLTRNFILAGVPSIVHSLWEVQDETSVVIMNKFYEYLSKGVPKNEALRKAKLDYINNVSPAMVNPYFWSGYIQSGNPAPVVKSNFWLYSILLSGVIVIFIFAFFIFYRRKI
jgi:CHAT domain-containing protein